MKILDKFKLQRKKISINKSALDPVKEEMAIMQKINHPHVLKLYEIIDDPTAKKLYLITELASRGNLQKKVEKDQ